MFVIPSLHLKWSMILAFSGLGYLTQVLQETPTSLESSKCFKYSSIIFYTIGKDKSLTIWLLFQLSVLLFYCILMKQF